MSIRQSPAVRQQQLAEAGARHPHGTTVRYKSGRCRCESCRQANTRYEASRAQARKAGDWNGLVDAGPAREHLLSLRCAGIGRRSVAAMTDVAVTLICEILQGKPRIRARTARKILAVTPDLKADGALVPAQPSWRLIAELREEGFTLTQISRRLGLKHKGIQIGRQRVTVRTAHRIEQVHRRLMA